MQLWVISGIPKQNSSLTFGNVHELIQFSKWRIYILASCIGIFYTVNMFLSRLFQQGSVSTLLVFAND